MDVTTNYFSLFDALLIRSASALASNNVRTTLRLKDLLTLDGFFKKDLFKFLCWLVSDNERELYFSRRCVLKFIHCQANNELLKVAKPFYVNIVIFPSLLCASASIVFPAFYNRLITALEW